MSNKHQLVKKNRRQSELDLTKITRLMLASVAGLLTTSGSAQAAHSNDFAAAMRANHMRHGGGLNKNQFHAMSHIRNQHGGNNHPALLGPPIRINDDRPNHAGRHAAMQEHQVMQVNDTGRTVLLDRGANIDLTADTRNITLGDRLIKDGSSVTIEVGGAAKTFQAGDAVTAAEYVAVKQVLAGGAQQLLVGADGRAEGGTVDLNSIAATKNTMRADSLTVSRNVTAIGDLDRHSTFILNGDLTNFGSLYVVNTSGGGGHKQAEIKAENINNSTGGLISSAAGLQFGNKSPKIDLTLNANAAVTNDGVIESSGTLSISAGNSIANNSGALIKAQQDVNLSAPNIQNKAMVSTAAGSITVDSPAVLHVDNQNGTLQALSGDVNIRSAHYQSAFDTKIVGGDLFSQKLNLHSGEGLIDVSVNQLSGEITGAGTAAHVSANTDTLTIGKVCLTGDPTFFNTGNIVLAGIINVGQDLAILASGNITATPALTNITARTGAGAGQNIFLVAGFALTTSGAPTASPTVGPFPGTGTALTGVQTVTAKSAGAPGGNIDLTGSTLFLVIDSSASAANQSGGNVQLVARANGATGGKVFLPANSVIATGGLGAGNNGNIQVAGGFNGNLDAIRLGQLNTTGSTSGKGGVVLIRATNPDDGGGTTFDANGVVTAGGFNFNGPVVATGGGINLQASITAAKDITIAAGPDQLFLSLAGSTIRTTGGDITITSAEDINLQGSLITDGGKISVSAADTISGSQNSQFKTDSSSGAGGTITFLADSDLNGTGILNLLNASATSQGFNANPGGNMSFQAGSKSTLTAPAFIVSNNGSTVNIGPTAGVVTVASVALGNQGILNISNNSGAVNLTAAIRTGTLNINAANDLINATNAITISVSSTPNLNNDTLNSGANTLTIANATIGKSIGVFGAAGTLTLPTALFNQITSQDLRIGSDIDVGGITVANADISGFNIGKLTFQNAGQITAGNIIYGSKDLSFFASLVAQGVIQIGNLTGTTGNVFIFNDNTATIGNVTSSGDFTVNSTKSITVGQVNLTGAGNALTAITTAGTISNTGTWQADSIVLSATGTATFSLNSTVTGNSGITLQTAGNLTNTGVPANNLISPVLNLSAQQIGVVGVPFALGPGVGAVSVSSKGDAIIQSNATAGVKLAQSIVSSGTLRFDAAGPLNVIGNLTTSDGDILITGASGIVRIEDNVIINANSPTINGDVFIGNAINGGNKKTDKIIIGDNVQILGNAGTKPGGNVTIQLGPVSSKIVTLTKAPNNVQYQPLNGGIIQGGKSSKPFTAGKKGAQPLSVITADNATVLISNTFSTKNLVLEGGVIITGDPPVVETSPTMLGTSVPTLRTAFNTTSSSLEQTIMSNAPSTQAGFAELTSIYVGEPGLTQTSTQMTQFAQMGDLLSSPSAVLESKEKNVMSYSAEDNSYAIGYSEFHANEIDISLCSDGDLGVTAGDAHGMNANGGTTVLPHSERVVFNDGKALFVPFRDTVVETPNGSVNIKAGAMAIVVSSSDKLAVFDLYDNHRGSVTVKTQGQSISLVPGRHLTLARGTSAFAQVNSIEAIPHRNVSSRTIPGLTAHSSEFSIPSAIGAVKPLKNVINSKHPQARAAAQRLMKTTAILLAIGGQNNYQHYFKAPAITAMLNR